MNTFPVNELGPVLQPFISATARSLTVAPETIGLPTLAALSAAIGNSRGIQLKADWTERPVVYGAIVDQTGSLKSQAQEAATQPVRERNQNYPGGRTWTSDVTVEGLADLLLNNPRGLLINRDEFVGLVKSFNQYKGGRGSDREFFLSAWGGQEYVVDRKGGPSIVIPHPFISVVGGIPPDILPELDMAGGRSDGFLDRLLFVCPDPHPIRWTDETVPQSIKDAYCHLINELYGLQQEIPPVSLDLTEEARRVWIPWHDDHCSQAENPLLSPGKRFGRFGAR